MSRILSYRLYNQTAQNHANSPQQPNQASDHNWPPDAPWHSRILSSWSDSQLLVDGLPLSDTKIINLANVPLPSNRDAGGPFDSGLSLSRFPHWIDTARAYSALALHDASNSNAPVDKMVNGLNHLFRLFGWCVLQRVYHLSELSPRDFEELADSLKPNGWMSALGVSKRLDDLVDRAAKDSALLATLIRPVPTDKSSRGAIHVESVSRELGVLMTSRELPFGFRQRLGSLAGLRVVTRASQHQDEWSESSFKNAFLALNRVARCPERLDSIVFEPFPNAREYARKMRVRPDGRTPNLAVDDAGNLMRTALKWINKRGPGVVELVKVWREALHEAKRRTSDKAAIYEFARGRVCEVYLTIKDKYELPGESLIGILDRYGEDNKRTLIDFIKRLETSVLIVVAVNQARRKNEVLGERGRPWGLYQGCVRATDPFIDVYELDIYIEKTLRDWAWMSCNKLVVDGVGILERLREAMYPDDVPTSTDNNDEARTRRLFLLPSYNTLLDPSLPAAQYSFQYHSAGFFEEVGLGREFWRTHIFRRLFALLYYYRFDHPSLQALSEALFHVDLECTRIYVTDPDMRAAAERIETVYREHFDASLKDDLAEVQQAYADDLVHAMLTSNGAGGPMTRRVQKIARRLAHAVSFDECDMTIVEEEIQKLLRRRGYAPSPDRHGACWAADNRFAHRALCAQDGKLHRERASIKMCHGCPNHSTSLGFLANIEREVEDLLLQANNTEDPLIAEALHAEANSLKVLIALELNLMDRYSNQEQTAKCGR